MFMLGVLSFALRRSVGARRLPTVACLALASATSPSHGQELGQPKPGDKPPEYQKLRYDEDYSYLKDPAKRTDFWDPIKYIPLSASGDTYLSLGGEARLKYELYKNYRWDPNAPDKDGYLLQRYLLSADLHLGGSIRVFGQLQSSLEDGRAGGARGTDENSIDIHQLFADFKLPLGDTGGDNDVTLRLGRQEMLYGSQRLISVRDSPNIRRSFDAVRLLTKFGDWHIDAFYSRPVEDDPGAFDDWGDNGTTFWGVYATHPIPFLKGANADLYFLDLDRPDAEFVQGTGDEHRQSVGTRVFGKAGGLDYNFEGVYQWGSFAGGDILAWTLASDTGYTFKDAAWTPRVGLRADIISGDTFQSTTKLGTFNPLFPRGAYFGEASLIGPANLIDIHPTLDLHVTEDVKVTADWDIFWRYSDHDGIYDNGGNVIRGPDGTAKFIGHQASIGVEWQIERHMTFNACYSHSFAGEYIKESGPGSDVDFIAVWATYRF
jgi:hypothetical protein